MPSIAKMTIPELEEALFEGPDQDIMHDIDTIIRSRSRIIQIVTPEEGRVITRLRQLTKARGRKTIFWTCASGAFTYNDNDQREKAQLKVGGKSWGDNRTLADPVTFLDFIQADDDIPPPQTIQVDGKNVHLGGGANYILLDLPNFMPSSIGAGTMSDGEIALVRKLKDIREILHEGEARKTIIIVSRDVFIPEDLKKLIPVLDWPLPTKDVIMQHLEPLAKEVEAAYNSVNIKKKFSKDDLLQIANSLTGLTLDEIASTFRQSAVRNPDKVSIDAYIRYNVKAKQDIIRKSRSGLEFYEPDGGIADNVGGLDELIRWLQKRSKAYSEQARQFNLEFPKGLLLIGVPGNGKSLIAKSIAYEWNVPLLRFDVGSVFSARVGSSEANIRNAIQTAAAVAPCVLWIDEIEKAFAGVGSSDRSDAGTAARVFKTFLEYLSEKKDSVFVVATANKIDQLPAEFVRKGRFDEIFFVDLPNDQEREEIFRIHFRKRSFDPKDFDIVKLVSITEDFTGAEIEAAIKEAMYTAFADNTRVMTTDDIVTEIESSVPLSLTMSEQIASLRVWANERAKWASKRNSSKEWLKQQLKEKQLQSKPEDGGLEILTPKDIIEGPDLGDGPQGEQKII